MLARNFKSAADLEITDQELDALIKVLGMFERNELIHRPKDSPLQPNGFNMAHWGVQDECGTIGCIRGWARIASGNYQLFAATLRHSPVGNLFTVDHGRFGQWDDITVEQAAMALRNFLSSGAARWGEILPPRDL